jgi:hypothetical protein
MQADDNVTGMSVLAAALYACMILSILNLPLGTSGFTWINFPARLRMSLADKLPCSTAISIRPHVLASFSSGMAHVQATVS